MHSQSGEYRALALGPHQDLVLGVFEVRHRDSTLKAPCTQRRVSHSARIPDMLSELTLLSFEALIAAMLTMLCRSAPARHAPTSADD
eukprot:674265-Rhodomonas_salina.1